MIKKIISLLLCIIYTDITWTAPYYLAPETGTYELLRAIDAKTRRREGNIDTIHVFTHLFFNIIRNWDAKWDIFWRYWPSELKDEYIASFGSLLPQRHRGVRYPEGWLFLPEYKEPYYTRETEERLIDLYLQRIQEIKNDKKAVLVQNGYTVTEGDYKRLKDKGNNLEDIFRINPVGLSEKDCIEKQKGLIRLGFRGNISELYVVYHADRILGERYIFFCDHMGHPDFWAVEDAKKGYEQKTITMLRKRLERRIDNKKVRVISAGECTSLCPDSDRRLLRTILNIPKENVWIDDRLSYDEMDKKGFRGYPNIQEVRDARKRLGPEEFRKWLKERIDRHERYIAVWEVNVLGLSSIKTYLDDMEHYQRIYDKFRQRRKYGPADRYLLERYLYGFLIDPIRYSLKATKDSEVKQFYSHLEWTDEDKIFKLPWNAKKDKVLLYWYRVLKTIFGDDINEANIVDLIKQYVPPRLKIDTELIKANLKAVAGAVTTESETAVPVGDEEGQTSSQKRCVAIGEVVSIPIYFKVDGIDIFPLIAPVAMTHRPHEDQCIRDLGPEKSSDLIVKSSTQVFIFLPGDIDELKEWYKLEKAEESLRKAKFGNRAGICRLGKDGDMKTVPKNLRIPLVELTHQKLNTESNETRNFMLWVNTSRCQSAEDAILMTGLGIGLGETPYIKLEIRGPDLMTKTDKVVEAIERLIDLNENIKIIPLIGKDMDEDMLRYLLRKIQIIGLRLEGTKPGSNQGLGDESEKKRLREMIEFIKRERPGIPLVAECGIGKREHVEEALGIGFDAILVNAAITQSADPVKTAVGFADIVKDFFAQRAVLANGGAVPVGELRDYEILYQMLISIYWIKKSEPDISAERLRQKLRASFRDVGEELYNELEGGMGFYNITEDERGNIIMPMEGKEEDSLIRIGTVDILGKDEPLGEMRQGWAPVCAGRYIIQFFHPKIFLIEKHIDIGNGNIKILKREKTKDEFSLSIIIINKDGAVIKEDNFNLGLEIDIDSQIKQLKIIEEMKDPDTAVLLYDLIRFMAEPRLFESRKYWEMKIELFSKIGRGLLSAIGKIIETDKKSGWKFYKSLFRLYQNEYYAPSMRKTAKDILIKFCKDNLSEFLTEIKPKNKYDSEDDLFSQESLLRILIETEDKRVVPLFIEILKAEMPDVSHHPGYMIGPLAYRRELPKSLEAEIPAYKFGWYNLKTDCLAALPDLLESIDKEEREKIIADVLTIFNDTLEKAREDLSCLLLIPGLTVFLLEIKDPRGIELIIKAMEFEYSLRENPDTELKYPGGAGPCALAKIGTVIKDEGLRKRITDKLIEVFHAPGLEKDYNLRRYCIWGLGSMKAIEAREFLEALAVKEDTNPHFRIAAIKAIGAIGCSKSISVLLYLLSRAEELDELDVNLKGFILNVMGPLKTSIDLLKEIEPSEIAGKLVEYLRYPREIDFAADGRDGFEGLFYLYKMWEYRDKISTELFGRRYPELRETTGVNGLKVIMPLFMEIFGKKKNGRPFMNTRDFNRLKNRIETARTKNAGFGIDSMIEVMEHYHISDISRSVFAEVFKKGNIKEKVWRLNQDYIQGLEGEGIDYDSLFNINDYKKVKEVLEGIIDEIPHEQKNIISMLLVENTGFSLKEFLTDSELIRIYADEVSEVLCRYGYTDELYFIRGKGIEFRFVGRTREDFMLGKKFGDCTAPGGHAFWSVSSYLGHPGYQTLLVYKDGELIDKLDLVIYMDETNKEPVFVIDAHEPVPQTEEGESAKPEFIAERIDVVKKGIGKAVEIAERAGFKRIYGAGISNRQFLEDNYDNNFKRQGGFMQISLLGGMSPLKRFIMSNGIVPGERAGIFLQSVSKGALPREAINALNDVEKNISRTRRNVFYKRNIKEIASKIKEDSLYNSIKEALDVLKTHGISLEHAIEILYGGSPATALARLFIIKESGQVGPQTVEEGADLKMIRLRDRAQRLFDTIRDSGEETERMDILLGELIPLVLDTIIEGEDSVLRQILTDACLLIDKDLARLFQLLSKESKGVIADINRLLNKKGYYLSGSRSTGKITRVITLKGRDRPIRVLKAKLFGKEQSFFSHITGLPIVQGIYTIDDKERRIELRRDVIHEAQHYLDREKALPEWIDELKADLANLAVGPEPLEYFIERARTVIQKMNVDVHDYYKEPLVFSDEHDRAFFSIMLLFFSTREFFEPFDFRQNERSDWWEGAPFFNVSLTPKEFNERFGRIFGLKRESRIDDETIRVFARQVLKEQFNEEIESSWFSEISDELFSPQLFKPDFDSRMILFLDFTKKPGSDDIEKAILLERIIRDEA